jgi:ABC-2 type transport system ATP-binding protein
MVATNERSKLIPLQVCGVVHQYGDKVALNRVDLEVGQREIFALLGPNGSGKSTLFRLISTLAKVQQGSISVFGADVVGQKSLVRSYLGVVFQSPSLDGKLTVIENLWCQGVLYGLKGRELQSRCDEVLGQLGMLDRKGQLCQELSGGMKRRVELAKGLLHRPRLLLMDEPSTGLDPAARLDLWHALEQLRDQADVTVLMTTHLLEEADKANRIAILDAGQVVACGAPSELRRQEGSEVITISTDRVDEVADKLERELALVVKRLPAEVRVTTDGALERLSEVTKAVMPWSHQVTVGRASLEDVFISKTGHQFWQSQKS